MSTENRHTIEPWRVAAMLMVTVIAAVAVYYLLTDPTRAVAAVLTLIAAVGCMAYLVEGTGP
jgi:hypothetical protein